MGIAQICFYSINPKTTAYTIRMRKCILLLVLFFFVIELSAQSSVSIHLITEPGVKRTSYLQFSFTDGTSQPVFYRFEKFSITGEYPNLNLFGYHKQINEGNYKVDVQIKTNIVKATIDTLVVDSATQGIDMFIYVSTKDSISDYVKEIKILKYLDHSDPLKFSTVEKPTLGSKAAFTIKNTGLIPLYGYPNNAFFFGALYEEIGDDAWTKHYPQEIEIKFCDTISKPKPINLGETTRAWTPNPEKCLEYQFVEKGKYYFELLFTDKSEPEIAIQEQTKILRQNIFREIFEFKVQ
jgi:hypothetical protein